LKKEITHSAVFSVGIGLVWRRKVRFSPYETGAHDCILAAERTRIDPHGRFRPLQLKSLVEFDPASLQASIDRLVGKYRDPSELYVAIFIDRAGQYDFSSLTIPPVLRSEIRELWVVGHFEGDREMWVFVGDLLTEKPKNYEIRITGPPPALLREARVVE
jgi:hypothetical protein